MKRLIVLALACAIAPLASATMYKYVDKDGKTVYSDTPPPGADAKPVRVTPSAGNGGPASKPATVLEKELEKGRALTKERKEKADADAHNAKLAEQRCQQARENYRTYEEGGRLFKYNDKGEREFLGDEEIEAKRISSKKEMDEACGGS
jgi:hypothetical protein